MRREENHKIASGRHVLSERIITNFANERDASETAHVKAFSGHSGQPIVQTVGVVINLIWTDAASEESVRWSTALLQQRKVDPLIQLNRKLRLREVLLDFKHRIALDARMVRHGHLRDGRFMRVVFITEASLNW